MLELCWCLCSCAAAGLLPFLIAKANLNNDIPPWLPPCSAPLPAVGKNLTYLSQLDGLTFQLYKDIVLPRYTWMSLPLCPAQRSGRRSNFC